MSKKHQKEETKHHSSEIESQEVPESQEVIAAETVGSETELETTKQDHSELSDQRLVLDNPNFPKLPTPKALIPIANKPVARLTSETDLGIHYPHGQVEASLLYVWDDVNKCPMPMTASMFSSGGSGSGSSSGGTVLIDQVTVGASDRVWQLGFANPPISAAYDEYILEFSGLYTTDSDGLTLLIGTGTTPIVGDPTHVFRCVYNITTGGANSVSQAVNSQIGFKLVNVTSGPYNSPGLCGGIRLYGPQHLDPNGVITKSIRYNFIGYGAGIGIADGFGYYDTADPITYNNVWLANPNQYSYFIGTIRIYGMAKK